MIVSPILDLYASIAHHKKYNNINKKSILLMLLDIYGLSFRGHCFPTNTTSVHQQGLNVRKTLWINLFFSSFFSLSPAFEANEESILSLWLLIGWLNSPLTALPLSPPPFIPWWDGNPPAPATIWWAVCRLVGLASCAKTPNSFGHRPQNLLGNSEGSWCWLAGWEAAWLSQSNPLECLHSVQ